MTKTRKYLLFVIITILALSLTGCLDSTLDSTANIQGDNLKVHYIDVGQGDAILIQRGQQNMLIDAGENEYGTVVVDYLKENGVSRLDYVVGTHPHSDHIGGLDDVIQSFEIGRVIMPKVMHNTKTFEDVLLAMEKKNITITTPVVGASYDLGEAVFTILSPQEEEYQNLNDYSVVLRLEYRDHSFLFTGDAEMDIEEEMLASHSISTIQSDVLKVGHHGSSSSTGDAFLAEVDPAVAVIQLGEDNSYGHPHREVIEKLEDKNIPIYRTDIHGTIVAISNGQEFFFEMENDFEKEEEKSPETNIQYIGNKNSKVFHLESCESLPAEKNRVYFHGKDQAIDQGYKPCQRCQP